LVGASGFEPHREENGREVKAPVTPNSCGAFLVSGFSVLILKGPGFSPSNPIKTGTVPVHGDGFFSFSSWGHSRLSTPKKFIFYGDKKNFH